MTACDLEPLMPGVAVHWLNSDKGRTFCGLEGVGTALVEMRIDFPTKSYVALISGSKVGCRSS
jgi:hypothetical protein